MRITATVCPLSAGVRLLVLPVVIALGVPPPARAQMPPQVPSAPQAQAATAEEESQGSPDSPRASLRSFLDATRAGHWADAARYLMLNDDQRSRGAELAQQLTGVLDAHIWLDLEAVSPEPGGRRDDGLSAGLEEIGRIPVEGGRTEPVRLVRTSDARGAYWVFSPATVSRIDAWYAALPDHRLRDLIAEAGLDSLLTPGPFELLWWQWIALPFLVVLALALGYVQGGVTRFVLGRLSARTRTAWDDRILAAIGPPLTLIWTLFVFAALLPFLELTVPAHEFLDHVGGAGVVATLVWALWRLVNVLSLYMVSRPWAESSPSARNLLSIGSNLTRGAIVGIGVLALLAALGYPVGTVLAGLGIGGLALAFGAQKTVENLFGSVSLAVDQPFLVGDFVKVEDFVGTVEGIGLRSTRFRTLDRTLISIPNGKLADQRLESFAVRDRMRLATTIGVEYGTTQRQMQAILEGFERVLRGHPRIWADAMVVKFKEFGASSLDIEIMAWFQVPTWSDFQQCRQEVLLGFMRVVEEAGTSFAFPTRTVHLVDSRPPSPGLTG